VLKPEVHERLVLEIDRFAEDANITPDWIWRALEEPEGSPVPNWIRRFHFHRREGQFGLLFVGKKTTHAPIEERMAAIAGALTRNFVRARLMPLNPLLDAVHEGVVPDMSCLLVPNFFVGASDQAAWRTAVLHDCLLQRQSWGLQTVLYVSDLELAQENYGLGVATHLATYFAKTDA
jgi:hypothetical protein